jgi:hypothetical protein
MSTNAFAEDGPLTREQSAMLFGQTMALVGLTAGAFALGCYLARNAGPGWGWLFVLAAFGALLGVAAVSSRSQQLALALLCGWGIARRRRGSDCLVLRTRRPPQGMECGHRDGSVHRRIRSRRLCDAPRPEEACPHPHVGTGGIAGVRGDRRHYRSRTDH